MKTLSIKQPWASLIAHGIKDIENRTWKTNFRGRILIHATANPAAEPYMIFSDEQIDVIENNMFEIIGSYYDNSMIIGSVEIVDCVQNDPSVWAEQGVWNWKLANPILFDKPITGVKGKLMLWEYEKIITNT